ncbi:hypothetical protein Syun_018417 [Stephania yunnanensis]|uniref:Uncharacterized protein n=1 Tax=Stephania yunnanensis TaxID=152371 RepID=A0AAP0ISV6_9MAGN
MAESIDGGGLRQMPRHASAVVSVLDTPGLGLGFGRFGGFGGGDSTATICYRFIGQVPSGSEDEHLIRGGILVGLVVGSIAGRGKEVISIGGKYGKRVQKFLGLAIRVMPSKTLNIYDSLQSHDPTGPTLQLQISTFISLFLLHSLLPLLPIPLPRSLPRLILSSAFAQEFLHFYLHRKDPSGLENRYFDLMLLPVSLCAVSALLRPDWAGGLARGVGLVMQGAWFVQMGFSFFTD